MSVEIIPAINVTSFEEFEKRIRALEKHAQWLHIDVADGIFTENVLFADPGSLKKVEPKSKVEAHLMVKDPEKVALDWIKNGAKRIIVHWEAVTDLDFLVKLCRSLDAELALAMNPETEAEALKDIANSINMVLVLGVKPGISGQKFQEKVLEKIAYFKKNFPKVLIEANGGMHVEDGTLEKVMKAGADLVAMGSTIFDKPDPVLALEEINKKIKLISN